MVTVESLRTWIQSLPLEQHRDGEHSPFRDPGENPPFQYFDPCTGEDPPFQYLHLPAGKTAQQPVERPQDSDVGIGDEFDSDSDSDDEDDSLSFLSDDMSDSAASSKRSYVSAGDKACKTYAKQLRKNGVISEPQFNTKSLGLAVMDIQVRSDWRSPVSYPA